MKLCKSILIALLAATSSLYSAAEAQKISPTVTKATTQQNAKQSRAELALKRFSDSIDLTFLTANIENINGVRSISFRYAIRNKSQRNIRNIHWATQYLHNGQVILIQDMPVQFKDGLKRNTTQELTFSLPFDQLNPTVQTLLTSKELNLQALHQAKSIVFSNGSKITVPAKR